MTGPADAILFLGPGNSPLLDWLERQEPSVLHSSERISGAFIERAKVGLLVSYGYRHILRRDVLEQLPGRAINLHISLLPWNRGADPNLWSFAENTPKGVTIHFIDEGIDTGDIIAQREVSFADSAGETLASTYRTLQREIQRLFAEHWADIKTGRCVVARQQGRGSYHAASEKERLAHLLTEGWNTPVSVLEKYAAEGAGS